MSSLGTWPATIRPRSCRFMLATNQRVHASPYGGSEQVVDLLNDRLMCSLTLPARKHTNAAALEAFLASFRGQTRTINAWHFTRPAPRGTLRGSPTLSAAAAQGAASLSIATTANATLLAGDMIGVGGLLLMVQSDAQANASGAMTVQIVNRLRAGVSSGAAVAWDRPTAPFRLMSHSGVQYIPGGTDEVYMELAEAIA
jgi:hypothetical protein